MIPATRKTKGNASALLLYMALELSNANWRLAFSDGVKRRQVPATDLVIIMWALAICGAAQTHNPDPHRAEPVKLTNMPSLRYPTRRALNPETSLMPARSEMMQWVRMAPGTGNRPGQC